MQTANFVPIYPKDLGRWVKSAMSLLKKVTCKDERKRRSTDGSSELSIASLAGPVSEDVSILAIAKDVSYDEDVMTNPINRSVQALRTGLTIAFHVENLYEKATGLDLLLKRNKQGVEKLPSSEQAELNSKLATAAAIASYVLASYVVWDLSVVMADGVRLVG